MTAKAAASGSRLNPAIAACSALTAQFRARRSSRTASAVEVAAFDPRRGPSTALAEPTFLQHRVTVMMCRGRRSVYTNRNSCPFDTFDELLQPMRRHNIDH
jgi:hypothetical protein